MKKTMLLSIITMGIIVGSCNKETLPLDNKDELKLTIEGKSFLIEDLKLKMGEYRGVDSERLIYNSEDTTFSVKNYEGIRFKIIDLLKK